MREKISNSGAYGCGCFQEKVSGILMDVGLLFESANYPSELRESFFRAESATAGRNFVLW